MFQEDPNEAVRPDFTMEEHQLARQQLINEGLTEEQAEHTLMSLWTLANNADKEHWAKKNKNKYVPLKHGKVPSDPNTVYTIRKLKVGEYCELHYFTNKGLEDAKATLLVADSKALVMLPVANGIHTWVPAAAVKDPKATAVVQDKNLTWEEFNKAMPHMINMMKVQDWPNDRVNMHIQF
ncbi:hypothetical protein F4604DRAFT_1883737 [Suillus subluteus]|nr:hypothetical protein F4604DRAFT_1883737 [Suillus subluteus]